MPDLPPHRAVRPCGYLLAPRVGQRPLRNLPQERALRTQGHRALSRNGDGHAAHLQQSPPASRHAGSLLGHGHEPVHRLRALRARVRRGSGRLRADAPDALGAQPHRNVSGNQPARIRLRILRRVHRRLPHRRAGRTRLQVGQGRRGSELDMPALPGGLRDEAGSEQAQPPDSLHTRPSRRRQSRTRLLQGQVRDGVRQPARPRKVAHDPPKRAIAAGDLARSH